MWNSVVTSCWKLQRRWVAQAALAFVGLVVIYSVYLSPSRLPPLAIPLERALQASDGPVIPSTTWQIYFPPSGTTTLDRKVFVDTSSWLAVNPGHTYTLFGDAGASKWVAASFSDRPDVVSTFHALRSPVLRSDLLRYLILAREGGTYSDIDTVAVKPINTWVPTEYRNRTRAVVGIEYDQRDDERWAGLTFPLQFCQWTIAMAPGHPIMDDVTGRVLRKLRHLESVHRTTLGDLKPTDAEVTNTTGPVMWTQAIFDHIYREAPHVRSWRDLSRMAKPTLFGDLLVLPVNYFGAGQPHSGSIREGPAEMALVRHGFRGSWKLEW